MKKKHSVKAIAVTMAALTSVSVVSAGMTTASAASVSDTAQAATVAAANKAIDKILEIGTENIPGGKIIGAAGAGVIDCIFGSIFSSDDSAQPDLGQQLKDLDSHVTRSTQEIRSDISALSSNIKLYHEREMLKLDDVNKKIDALQEKVGETPFITAYKKAEAQHKLFISALNNNMNKISSSYDNERLKKIDTDTLFAYNAIIQSSQIESDFYELAGYFDKNSDGGFDDYYTLLADIAMNEYNADTYTVLTAPTQDPNVNGITTLEELGNVRDLTSAQKELKGFQADMALYYNDCVILQKLKSDVDNYNYITVSGDKATDAAILNFEKNNLETYGGNIDDLTAEYRLVQTAYSDAGSYIHAHAGADITIATTDGTVIKKEFADPMCAWYAVNALGYYDANDTIQNATFDLQKDMNSNQDFGLNTSAALDQAMKATINNCNGLVVSLNGIRYGYNAAHKPIDFTVNLNGHTINLNNCASDCALGFVGTNGTVNVNNGTILGGNCTLYGTHLTGKESAVINLNNVTLTSTVDGKKFTDIDSMFFLSGNYRLNLNNCTVHSAKTDTFHMTGGATYALNNTVVGK